jgi:CDP-diacylglycerol--serine O-phosphatidyltransferase
VSDRVNAANAITSASLACGFGALVLAADGHLVWAAVAVVVAAVLDLFDGMVARRLDVCGRFGSELDSLADLVAFGVAPAFMLLEGPVRDAPALGVPACMAFVLAGAWRLARFSSVQRLDHFVGVPIPAAGLVLGVGALALPVGLALGLPVVLALLMVSTIPFPKPLTLARLGTPRRRRARLTRAGGPALAPARHERRRMLRVRRPRRRARDERRAAR